MAGETLVGDDLMVKRGFKGDAAIYESAVSEDGTVMVVLDTRQDEKVRAYPTIVWFRWYQNVPIHMILLTCAMLPLSSVR